MFYDTLLKMGVETVGIPSCSPGMGGLSVLTANRYEIFPRSGLMRRKSTTRSGMVVNETLLKIGWALTG